MKKTAERILCCLFTICLTVSSLYGLTKLTERKESYTKYAYFFNQNKDFDVMFYGTSHVINGVLPMELWEDYGITSYNFGGHSNKMATTYWSLVNSLDYAKPKVVVVDLLHLATNWKSSDIFSFLHQSFDAFPLSANKVRAVYDLLDDPYLEADIEAGAVRESAEPRNRFGLLWEFASYHSRWNDIHEDDFDPFERIEKGAESRVGVFPATLDRIDSSVTYEDLRTGEIYLRKMIELCQENDIEIIITYLPFPATEEQQMEANHGYAIAEEYGIEYINFLDMDIIDYETDCYDMGHLNPSGAKKVTSYLGRHLMDNYGIESHLDDPDYSHWADEMAMYDYQKNCFFQLDDTLYNHLLLLYDDKITAIIDIRNRDIFKDSESLALLENAGVDAPKLNDSTDFIIFYEGQQIAVLDNVRNNTDAFDTDLGKVKLYKTKDDIPAISINDTEYLICDNADADMAMTLYRGDDEEAFDTISFNYSYSQDSAQLENITAQR